MTNRDRESKCTIKWEQADWASQYTSFWTLGKYMHVYRHAQTQSWPYWQTWQVTSDCSPPVKIWSMMQLQWFGLLAFFPLSSSEREKERDGQTETTYSEFVILNFVSYLHCFAIKTSFHIWPSERNLLLSVCIFKSVTFLSHYFLLLLPPLHFLTLLLRGTKCIQRCFQSSICD